MEVIRKKLSLDKDKYYRVHLEIVNSVLPTKMSKRELDILAGFMSLEGEVVEQYRFGTDARSMVRDKLGISASNMSNYFDKLVKKGFIKPVLDERGRRKLEIIPLLRPQKHS